MDAGDMRCFRFDISGQGDIDDQEGAAGALLHDGREHPDGDDGARGGGGTDDDIGFEQRLAQIGKSAMRRAQPLSQVYGVRWCAIDNDEPLRAMLAQILRGQFAHFAGSDEQHTRLVQVREELTCQLHSHVADRGGIATDGGLAASALPGDNGRANQGRAYGPRVTGPLSDLQGIDNLPLDLWFTWHQRIEARGDAEQMRYSLFIYKCVAMTLKFCERNRLGFSQRAHEVRRQYGWVGRDGV